MALNEFQRQELELLEGLGKEVSWEQWTRRAYLRYLANPDIAPVTTESVQDRKFLIWALDNKLGHPPTLDEATEFLNADFETRRRIWMRKE